MRPGLAALGRHGIELVDEDDRRRMVPRLAEYPAQVGFGLSGVRPDDVGAVDIVVTGLDFIGNGPRQVGFAGSRWPVQENSAWRIDPQMAVHMGKLERKLDEF